jgi:Flp pilus assembly pilin Flp
MLKPSHVRGWGLRDQRGLGTIEYAVLFVCFIVAALVLWSKLSGSLHSGMDDGTGRFDKMLGAANQQGLPELPSAVGSGSPGRGGPGSNAAATRATKGGSSTVPQLSEIQKIRKLEFRVESGTPEVKAAVEKQLAALRAEHPDWTFSASYGP